MSLTIIIFIISLITFFVICLKNVGLIIPIFSNKNNIHTNKNAISMREKVILFICGGLMLAVLLHQSFRVSDFDDRFEVLTSNVNYITVNGKKILFNESFKQEFSERYWGKERGGSGPIKAREISVIIESEDTKLDLLFYPDSKYTDLYWVEDVNESISKMFYVVSPSLKEVVTSDVANSTKSE